MKHAVLAALAFATMGAASAAHATVVTGTFAGTITSGDAHGSFGYDYPNGADLTGQGITGMFSYDTSKLTTCSGTTSFYGCLLGSSGVTITETVNGVTVTVVGAPSSSHTGDAFDSGASGLQLYNLTADTLAISADSAVGDPATVYVEEHAGLNVLLDRGTIADAGNPVVAPYNGSASNSVFGTLGPYSGSTFLSNETQIYELDAGNYSQKTDFNFNVTSFTTAIQTAGVPEPSAWAFMVAGFGLLGGAMRRRPRVRAA